MEKPMSRIMYTCTFMIALIGTAHAALDIKTMTIEATPDMAVVTIIVNEDYDFPNTQILLDTDDNPATGFMIDTCGFDVLIEGATLYKFAGTEQTEWLWSSTLQVTRKLTPKTMMVQIPRKIFNSRRVPILARIMSKDYATVLSSAPATGKRYIDLTAIAPVKEQAAKTPADKSLKSLDVSQVGGNIIITVTTEGKSSFSTLFVFIDDDNNPKTGFQSGNAPQFGFDSLISSHNFMAFTGQPRTQWQWQNVGEVKRTVNDNKLTIMFNGKFIKGTTIGVCAWFMSDDWMELLSQQPAESLKTIKLDRSKITDAPEVKKPLASPHQNRALPARERVAHATNYCCYYGTGKVPELSYYDLVIAHPPYYKRQDMEQLQKLGVVVVGYISVGESHGVDKGDGKGPGGMAGWYFDKDKDGQPDKNGIWNSYYANANDPAWRADCVRRAKDIVENQGYDGVFLDTIGTSDLFPESKPGMIRLISEFRKALPNAPIILNQGYSILSQTAPYGDAVMLESFSATYDFDRKEYTMNDPSSLDMHTRNVKRYIQPAMKKNPFKVLVLDYANPGDTETLQKSADRAATFGFLWSAAPISLDEVYDTNIKGKADRQWLRRQATPEKMGYTVTEPQNGFPAGTVILPSSCYGGYKVSAIIDGISNRSKMDWSKAAWASADDGEDAYLEFRFPKPLCGGKLEIRWATDDGKLYISRNYMVQVKQDDEWKTLSTAQDNEKEFSTYSMPPTPYETIRIFQPKDGGSKSRPGLMWIAQVKLSETKTN